MTSTEATFNASKEPTTQTITSNHHHHHHNNNNNNNNETAAASPLVVLSARAEQKLPDDLSHELSADAKPKLPDNNSPKITRKSKEYKGSKPIEEDRLKYNCKFWVNTGHCRHKDTTCKRRHDEERRNVWPWDGNQDDIFPDLKGVYSE